MLDKEVPVLRALDNLFVPGIDLPGTSRIGLVENIITGVEAVSEENNRARNIVKGWFLFVMFIIGLFFILCSFLLILEFLSTFITVIFSEYLPGFCFCSSMELSVWQHS